MKKIALVLLLLLVVLTEKCFADGMYTENCSMPYYLVPGNHAEIINTTGLKLHREPAGEEISGLQVFPEKDITILDGPVCKEGKVWFEIDFLGRYKS